MDNKLPVSELLSMVVKPDCLKEFEQWHQTVVTVLNQQQGFVGSELIRPADISAPEYFIIIKFNKLADLERWKKSDEYTQIKQATEQLVINVMIGEKQFGTEMLFSRPLNNIYYPKPAFWKQAVISVITVYPLVLLSIKLIGPFTKALPLSLALLISICIVSPIMVFIMPNVSKLFYKWLYP